MLFLFLFTSFCISSSLLTFAESIKDKLLLVHAVWRHGDRAPISTYKTDPYQESQWPQGWGQLTTLGMSQHVNLGKRLRKRYIETLHFISPFYDSKEIHVRSSDYNRTFASAISNLIGFYSKNGRPGIDFPAGENWPRNFIPVPIHTESEKEDYDFLISNDRCPRKAAIHKTWKQTDEYRKLATENKWLFEVMAQNCGQNVTIGNINAITGVLFIEKLHNLTLPKWTLNKTLITAMSEVNKKLNWMENGIGIKTFNGVNFELELPRIRGGPLIWHIIANMREKVKCIETPNSVSCNWINRLKYFVFSAHDTNLASIYTTLGLKRTMANREEFPFTTCLTFELWQRPNNSSYVKVLIWLPERPIHDLTNSIVGCEFGCDLEEFAKRSEIYRPLPSIEAYCKNTDFSRASIRELKWSIIIIIIIHIAILFGLSLIIV